MKKKLYFLPLLAAFTFVFFSHSAYCQSFSIDPPFSLMCLDDGEAEIILDNIPEPVTVVWENITLQETHTGLNPTDLKNGQYQVSVTGADGNIYVESYYVESQVYWYQQGWSLAPCPNGEAPVSIGVYTENYPASIFINDELNGTTTENSYTSTDLPIGAHEIYILDDLGCRSPYTPVLDSDSNSVWVNGTTDLEVLITGVPDFCAGLYEVSYEITNETAAPYIHQWEYWSNGEWVIDYSGTLSEIPNATYITLRITDGDGCEKTFNEWFYSPSSIQSNGTSSPATCPLNDGSIDMNVYGGTAPYSFLWSNGSTTEDISGLASGVYELTVTDADGCTNTFSKYVGLESPITVTGSVIPPNCEENIPGVIDITVSNTTGAYNILWSTGETTEDISFTNFGYYYVTITDSQGCVQGKSFWVPVSAPCYSYATGTVYYDLDGDCMEDPEDFPFYHYVFSTNGNYVQNTYSNADMYSVKFLDDITLSTELGGYSLNCPDEDVALAYDPSQTYSGNDFFLQPNSLEDDLRVWGHALNPVPGFTTNGSIGVSNEGSTVLSGTITLEFDPIIEFQYSSPAPTSVDNELGIITWEIENLVPFAYEYIQVNYYTESTVELGLEVDYLVSIVGDFTDVNPENNQNSFSREVIGSYDPNDKQVFPSGEGETNMIHPLTDKLDYMIRFQNTGSAPAINVVIEDDIDLTTLNISDMQITGSSHDLTDFMVHDGKAFFVFENIYLPDSTSNLEASQGFVSFRIGVNSGLPLGTVIENDAAIFFDFNEPIITNNAFVTLDLADGVNERNLSKSPKVFPNPTEGNFTVTSDLGIDAALVMDVSGRIIWSKNYVNATDLLHIELPLSVKNGIYFIKTQSGELSSETRLVLIR